MRQMMGWLSQVGRGVGWLVRALVLLAACLFILGVEVWVWAFLIDNAYRAEQGVEVVMPLLVGAFFLFAILRMSPARKAGRNMSGLFFLALVMFVGWLTSVAIWLALNVFELQNEYAVGGIGAAVAVLGVGWLLVDRFRHSWRKTKTP